MIQINSSSGLHISQCTSIPRKKEKKEIEEEKAMASIPSTVQL
jgi:hypothetical protein